MIVTRAAVVTAVLGLALTGCGKENQSARTGPSTGPTPVTSPTAHTPTPAATPTAAPGAMLVPVYYLGDTQQGARLYREFRSMPRSAAVVRAAVDAMLHLTPLDPDYRSGWPRTTTIRGVTVSGDLATVDLSQAAGGTKDTMSLQQLVHTVTAAAPSVRRVQLLVEGRAAGAPMSRANRLDTLAAIWVIQPTSGATVARTFAFSGDATVFEGTVSWDVRSCTSASAASCATVVRNGFTTTEGAPARGAWSVTVTLPASVTTGSYVEIRAWEDSAKDGTPTYRDTKIVRMG